MLDHSFTYHAFQMGIYLAFVYDLLRVLRRAIPRGIVFASLEDLAFWCYCAGEVFFLLQRENHGILRWYAVCAAAAGIWAYEKLASPLLLRYGTRILKKLLTGPTRVAKIIGKGVKCHAGKILRRRAKQDADPGAKEKKSSISQAPAEPRQHVSCDGGSAGDRRGDRGERRGTSEKDRCL
ncbi:MAG: spore cortex biosynthesis protein YabQ [Lachnospiraceae bacterium]|nr:spore cortex biosynthesis protein YabQ [Lachnospiraceae bacterium]